MVSSTFSVLANSAVKLQVLVPGEFSLPGSPTGKTVLVGISTQAAGVAVPITVNAVDLNWNIVPANAQLTLVTNDPYAAALAPQTLSAGATVFNMIFAEATVGFSSGWTVTASTTSGSATTLAAGTSALIPVNPGAATKLQIVLPNQMTVHGNAAIKGRTGAPLNATAGIPYSVTVNLTDDFYNVQKVAAMPSVQLVSSDPNDIESNYVGGNPHR